MRLTCGILIGFGFSSGIELLLGIYGRDRGLLRDMIPLRQASLGFTDLGGVSGIKEVRLELWAFGGAGARGMESVMWEFTELASEDSSFKRSKRSKELEQ